MRRVNIMNVIAVTGPRRLTDQQHCTAATKLRELLEQCTTTLHVGDAPGVDAIALHIAKRNHCYLCQYVTQGVKAWQLQARSKEMVHALAGNGGTLHAFPNKPCPADLTPTSWKGSGTWGTVRYAVKKGVQVELHPLTEDATAPDWLLFFWTKYLPKNNSIQKTQLVLF